MTIGDNVDFKIAFAYLKNKINFSERRNAFERQASSYLFKPHLMSYE